MGADAEDFGGGGAAEALPDGLPSHLRPVELIGRGGSSAVWRARDRRAGRDVAVKVVRLAGGSTTEGGQSVRSDRFEHELRALTRLATHPHVLDLLAAGMDGRLGWVVTPLARASLWDELTGGGPVAALDVASLSVALASALHAAHLLDVVHGDVTPANVLFVDGCTVLADFGLAVLEPVAQRPSGAARFGATPGWAAPERLDGSAPTPASDVYGLGATVWSAATGARPPLDRPPDRTAVPRGLDAIVAACCEVDPRRRPVAAEVQKWADSERRRRQRYCPGP